MAENRYKFEGRTEIPLVKTIRMKYEEMFIFGEIEDNCKKFGVSEDLIRKIAYNTRKSAQTMLNFDTIIKLSNMFDIPYEEFINYNALINHNRNKKQEELERENEMLKQYQVGKKWEDEVIKMYSDRDYFVYKIPTMNNGTVFDIFVARKGSCMMIECKHTYSDKLYYVASGIYKKKDELDHFVDTTKNNVYIFVKSDRTGMWWTTWVKAKPIFEEKGCIDIKDCVPFSVDNIELE